MKNINFFPRLLQIYPMVALNSKHAPNSKHGPVF